MFRPLANSRVHSCLRMCIAPWTGKVWRDGCNSERLRPTSADRTTNWLKAKCYDEAEFNIVGVQREHGKPATALMAYSAGKHVRGAFVTLPQGTRQRLWDRVQAKAGAKPPKGLVVEKAEWAPGLCGPREVLARRLSPQNGRERPASSNAAATPITTTTIVPAVTSAAMIRGSSTVLYAAGRSSPCLSFAASRSITSRSLPNSAINSRT